ncbi:uncharacterized protein LOC125493767 [Beta vulgaris subsp. vulgaris]|uniref:uncharacterized protein LOC125493767 n=1 Tax=Beta vulgaris subsp. vulgaris TaxID=3555 RepID=UPI00203704BD|nr:uncharacterized protein LOC125493767 [Beta vulgaris subsp. vulgaris]
MSFESSYKSHISTSDSSNSDDLANSNQANYRRRYERRRQANHMMDHMMDGFIMANPAEIYAAVNQVPRAPRTLVPRDRESGPDRLWSDYFADNPIFPPNYFRRRFRMQKYVFLRIGEVLTTRNEFFKHRPDATGRLGASGLQKCTTAIRLLAYDTSFDSVDNHLRISASLARDSLQLFVEGVVSHFSDEYLRQPTEIDYYLQLNNGDHLA